jgi:hypothetical protein
LFLAAAARLCKWRNVTMILKYISKSGNKI